MAGFVPSPCGAASTLALTGTWAAAMGTPSAAQAVPGSKGTGCLHEKSHPSSDHSEGVSAHSAGRAAFAKAKGLAAAVGGPAIMIRTGARLWWDSL